MDLIYAISYQGPKVKKAHEYLKYDALDRVRLGYGMLRTPIARPINTVRWLGYGAFVAAPYALAWKLPQSLWYVGIKCIDAVSSGVVHAVTKGLRNIPRTGVETQRIYGWLKSARPSRNRTVEGWTPYGFRPRVPGPGAGRGVLPLGRAGGWWGWRWNHVPHPGWLGDAVALPGNGVALPQRPAETFDPNEVTEGIKVRSPELWTRYNQWISNAILQDAETIGRSILTERFPAGHVQAGQPRYAAFLPAFRVANLHERAQRLDRARRALAPGHPNRRLFARQAIFLRLRADAAARQEGFANAAAAVALRDAHLDHLFDVNAMNMTNILQRDFERQEVQHILNLVVKLKKKELWHFAKYGYTGYEGTHKEQAKLAHGRLLGLLQEVDPLHGRRQGVPMAL